MVQFYARLIRAKKLTLEQVPVKWREAVRTVQRWGEWIEVAERFYGAADS